MVDPMVTLCRNPTPDNARKLIEAELDKDTRTCNIIASLKHAR